MLILICGVFQCFTRSFYFPAKAKQLISCNPRMEKALESVAQSNTGAPVSTPEVQAANPPTPAFKNTKLLKGIPNSLLEKVK